jgi:hypothetical protein
VLRGVGFADVSPDGRFVVSNIRGKDELVVTSFPTMRTSAPLALGNEAEWVSTTTVRFRGVLGWWYEVTVDSALGRVRGAQRPYYYDPRFSDTPGWSHRAVSNGGMIYVQGPARSSAGYLRVVPNWVEKMKQAVDSAERNAK